MNVKVPILLILAVSMVGYASFIGPVHANNASTPGFFTNLVWIVMENHNGTDISNQCATNATYQCNLQTNNAQATKFDYESISGSLPNYIAMFFGYMALGSSCDSTPATCGTTASHNIIDVLANSGLTWKGYMEGMSSSNICSGGGSTDGGTKYIAHHNPFVYASDIASDATRCQQVVPAGSFGGISGSSCTNDGTLTGQTIAGTLQTDLATPSTAPNLMYLVPNNCDNSHDGPNTADQVGLGSLWLSDLIPNIISSATCTAHGKQCAILVTYDEGRDFDCCTFRDKIYTVFAGSAAQQSYSTATQYNHYSILRTIEDNWGLSVINASNTNDANANTMTNMLVAYAPPVASPNPGTLIGTTTESNQPGFPGQQQAFYAQGRHWLFYSSAQACEGVSGGLSSSVSFVQAQSVSGLTSGNPNTKSLPTLTSVSPGDTILVMAIATAGTISSISSSPSLGTFATELTVSYNGGTGYLFAIIASNSASNAVITLTYSGFMGTDAGVLQYRGVGSFGNTATNHDPNGAQPTFTISVTKAQASNWIVSGLMSFGNGAESFTPNAGTTIETSRSGYAGAWVDDQGQASTGTVTQTVTLSNGNLQYIAVGVELKPNGLANCVNFVSSTDGINWSQIINLNVTAQDPLSSRYGDLTVISNSTHVFYTRCNCTQNGKVNDVVFRLGTLSTTGTIAWQNEIKIISNSTATEDYYGLTMTQSSTGRIFSGYTDCTSNCATASPIGSNYVIFADKNSYSSWTGSFQFLCTRAVGGGCPGDGNGGYVRSILQPMTRGQVYLTTFTSTSILAGFLYDGTSWTSPAVLENISNGNCGTSVNQVVQSIAVGDTVYDFWVANGGECAAARVNGAWQNNGVILGTSATSFCPGSPQRLECLSITYESNTNTFYLFYYNSALNQIQEYKGYPWNPNPIMIYTTGTDSNTKNYIQSFSLSANVNSTNWTIGLWWTEQISSPFNIYYGVVNGLVPTVSPPGGGNNPPPPIGGGNNPPPYAPPGQVPVTTFQKLPPLNIVPFEILTALVASMVFGPAVYNNLTRKKKRRHFWSD